MKKLKFFMKLKELREIYLTMFIHEVLFKESFNQHLNTLIEGQTLQKIQ